MPDATIERLIGRFGDPDHWKRRLAVMELTLIGPTAIPTLREALRDPRLTVRVDAIKVLGALHDAGAIPALADIVAGTGSTVLAEEAAVALVRIREAAREAGDPSAERAADAALAAYRSVVSDSRRPPESLWERRRAEGTSIPRQHTPVEIYLLLCGLDPKDEGNDRSVGDRLAVLEEPGAAALAEELTRWSFATAVRTIHAIGWSDAPTALVTLARLRGRCRSRKLRAACDETLRDRIAQRPPAWTIEHLDALLLLVTRWKDLPPAAGIFAAETLTRLARTDPRPELRRVLSALRGSAMHPVPPEFTTAWKAIDAATAALKDMPVSASAPPTDPADLPRPAEGPDG